IPHALTNERYDETFARRAERFKEQVTVVVASMGIARTSCFVSMLQKVEIRTIRLARRRAIVHPHDTDDFERHIAHRNHGTHRDARGEEATSCSALLQPLIQ